MSASRCFVWSLTRRFLDEWNDKIYVEHKKSVIVCKWDKFIARKYKLHKDNKDNIFILNYLS